MALVVWPQFEVLAFFGKNEQFFNWISNKFDQHLFKSVYFWRIG
jgi:hypothetical protein